MSIRRRYRPCSTATVRTRRPYPASHGRAATARNSEAALTGQGAAGSLATGTMTAAETICSAGWRRYRWRGRHRQRPGRGRDASAAAHSRALLRGPGRPRDRPGNAGTDVTAAAHPRTWFHGRPWRCHGRRSRTAFKPLQFLSIELVGNVVARRSAGPGDRPRPGPRGTRNGPVADGGTAHGGRLWPRRTRPRSLRLRQSRHRNCQSRHDGNAVQ
jgi:hypothetical protein